MGDTMLEASQVAAMPHTPSSVGISAIVRNEAPYLLEWIAHHRLVGVERFFIVDDRSDDGSRELLAAMETSGLVSLLRTETATGKKPQIPAYRALLEAFRSEVEWMAFIDIDEYIWPTGSHRQISEFLSLLPADIGAVALNWATFGSSRQLAYDQRPTPERFTWHAQFNNPVNHNIKTVARTASARDFTCPHNVTIDPASRHVHTDLSPKAPMGPNGRPDKLLHCLSESVCWSQFRLNHYVIRSWEEFQNKKARRGRAFTDYPLDPEFFAIHDFAETQSQPGDDYLARLRQEMSTLQVLMPGIDWSALRPSLQPVRTERLSPIAAAHHGGQATTHLNHPAELQTGFATG